MSMPQDTSLYYFTHPQAFTQYSILMWIIKKGKLNNPQIFFGFYTKDPLVDKIMV